MTPGENGWHAATTGHATAGTAYAFRLKDGSVVPDPASRAQRGEVHGPSLVVDPAAYRWRCPEWRGRPWHETVLYEMHVGTATRDGTFTAAETLLDGLADLGVTAIELMPVADFTGSRNWGYDGVLPFAPASAYGTPDDLKALIDAAHLRGLTMFLDVVYNHFGPEGNYLPALAPRFFDESRHTPWGAAIDYSVREVRDFVIANAVYWVEEYRFDGLRLDAVHAISDESKPHILMAISAAVRDAVGGGRHVHLVLENDANEAHYLRGPAPAYAAQWNDDFHHAAHVVLTGERDGYYEDYADDPVGCLARALAQGFVYQGEASRHRGGAARGEPSGDLSPIRFVDFLQNHDQVGNRAFGDRLAEQAAPEALRALTAVLLLAPSIPMLFMGEEIASHAPFPFFCDFAGPLADAVREGRRAEFTRFQAFSEPSARERIPDPNARETFDSARPGLDSDPSAEGTTWRGFVRALLALRHRQVVPLLDRTFEGAVVSRAGGSAFAVAWRFSGGARYEIVANLGPEPAAYRDRPAGQPFFTLPDNLPDPMQASLPPWSVHWSMQAG